MFLVKAIAAGVGGVEFKSRHVPTASVVFLVKAIATGVGGVEFKSRRNTFLIS